MTSTVSTPTPVLHPLDEFVQRFRRHDVFYSYSDDPRVWSRGSDEYRALLVLARQLPRDAVRATVEAVASRVLERESDRHHYVTVFLTNLDAGAAQ